MRRDAVEQKPRGFPLRGVPGCASRGDEVGLRAQDHPVLDHLEAVGGERGAGGGDIDDHFGGAGRGRGFGGARAFHDAVIDDAVLGKEGARQIGVFGGEPHFALVLEPERGGDIVEVGHAAHVDPGLRHGDDDIGETEAEPVDEHDLPVGVGDHLAHQILAGDAEMDGALRELRGDFRRRQIGDLDAVKSGDGAAVVARSARLDELKPGARKEGLGVLLQAAFRGDGEKKRGAHAAPPQAASSSIEAAKPTAGIGSRAPSRDNSPS